MTNVTRRNFVKGLTLSGAASTIGFPSIIRAQGLNEKLQVGFVAVGGRAGAHTAAAHKAGLQCIAFAETDKTRWSGAQLGLTSLVRRCSCGKALGRSTA